jgi:hypothetical protein
VVSGTEENALISGQLLLIEAMFTIWHSIEELLELTAVEVIELADSLFV